MKDTKKFSLKTYFNRFLSVLPINAFLVFTVLFFAPLEVYNGNVNEFSFSWRNIVIVMAGCSLILTIVGSLIESFIPKKIISFINAGVFGIGIMFYVQPLLLNGYMQSLTGEEATYPINVKIFNALIWLAVIAVFYAILILVKKFKKVKTYRKSLTFVSLALIVMQLTAFISSSISMPDFGAVKNHYLSSRDEFVLGKETNVVYFVIDTCDGEFVKNALKQDPDMFKDFDGFTYYPNMMTTHSRTYPSVPYLLTKQMCYFDKPYNEYIAEAHANSTFLEDIKDSGADLRIYTDSGYVDDITGEIVDNYTTYDSESLSSISILGMIKKMTKVSLFRGLPYVFKAYFQYTSSNINDTVTALGREAAIQQADLVFADRLVNQKLSVSSDYVSAFRFYHMFGIHPGCYLDENAEYTPITNQVAATRGNIKIISEYINQMKTLGVYDNSTIIVTADHGMSQATDDLLLHSAPTCILLVKPAGASNPVKTSNAPVCHNDLFATVLEGFGVDGSEYGRTVFDIGENEERERTYYHSSLHSDIEGEIALREYTVNGDARDFASWKLTGKYWDINYSERAVSPFRLKVKE